MVDNRDEFEGNAHLRRQAQFVEGRRCAVCHCPDGMKIHTPDGEKTIKLVQQTVQADGPLTINVCEWCNGLLQTSAKQIRQMMTTQPVEVLTADDVVEQPIDLVTEKQAYQASAVDPDSGTPLYPAEDDNAQA